MSLEYEPSSEPLHIYVKHLVFPFLEGEVSRAAERRDLVLDDGSGYRVHRHHQVLCEGGGSEMCCGSEAGSYLRLIDFMYHSTLGLRVTNVRQSRPDSGFGFQVQLQSYLKMVPGTVYIATTRCCVRV